MLIFECNYSGLQKLSRFVWTGLCCFSLVGLSLTKCLEYSCNSWFVEESTLLITASVPSPAELRHFFLIIGFCSLPVYTSIASAVTALVAISHSVRHANEALQAIASVLLRVNNDTIQEATLHSDVCSISVCWHHAEWLICLPESCHLMCIQNCE